MNIKVKGEVYSPYLGVNIHTLFVVIVKIIVNHRLISLPFIGRRRLLLYAFLIFLNCFCTIKPHRYSIGFNNRFHIRNILHHQNIWNISQHKFTLAYNFLIGLFESMSEGFFCCKNCTGKTSTLPYVIKNSKCFGCVKCFLFKTYC